MSKVPIIAAVAIAAALVVGGLYAAGRFLGISNPVADALGADRTIYVVTSRVVVKSDQTYEYEYDEHGNMTSMSFDGGSYAYELSYEHDEYGNVTAVTSDGTTTAAELDLDSKGRTVESEQQTFEYYESGHVKSVTFDNGSYTQLYSENGFYLGYSTSSNEVHYDVTTDDDGYIETLTVPVYDTTLTLRAEYNDDRTSADLMVVSQTMDGITIDAEDGVVVDEDADVSASTISENEDELAAHEDTMFSTPIMRLELDEYGNVLKVYANQGDWTSGEEDMTLVLKQEFMEVTDPSVMAEAMNTVDWYAAIFN